MTNVNEKLEAIKSGDDTRGERHYSKAFRSAYQVLRQSLVVLHKARSPTHEGGSREKGKDGKYVITKGKLVKEAELTHEEACAKLSEIMEDVATQLE